MLRKTFLFAMAMSLAAPALAQTIPSADQGKPMADLIAAAKAEGAVNSVGMPDNWANWKDTWVQITDHYGIKHFDTDMSSAQELSVFENEGKNATADIGDVGIDFGPIAVKRDLVQPYKPAHWDQIPAWAKDTDGKWAVPYTGSIAFVIRSDVKNPPHSWKELLNGKAKFSIDGVGSAAQSNAAVLAAAIAMGGGEADLQPGIDLFAKLAEAGRLRANATNPTTMEHGETEVAALWDFNALNYAATVGKGRYTVLIPADGSVTSGYASVINKFAPHPNAAKLTREYIFSDQGQINLARGYARPIRIDHIKLPDDVKALVLPSEQYKAARPIDAKAWQENAPKLGGLWQEDVLSRL